MRDASRIGPLLNLLEQAWLHRPDLRLGQVLHVAAEMGGWRGIDVFYVEEETIGRGLLKMIESCEAKEKNEDTSAV